ncbi:hypothetical protein ACEW7V_00565 [Areca yellow leaf disease phytoplasma]|uniref:hypothetical protein n=1 Tax=Areca yellow leaf disease phytoplasma TaxID=927614 RepID=UPI0035B50E40
MLIQADFGTKTTLFLMQAIKDEINSIYKLKISKYSFCCCVLKCLIWYQNMKGMKGILESPQEQEKRTRKQNQDSNPTNPKDTFSSISKITCLKCICLQEQFGVGKQLLLEKWLEALKQEGKKVSY